MDLVIDQVLNRGLTSYLGLDFLICIVISISTAACSGVGLSL